MSRFPYALLALALVVLSGCPAGGMYRSARTLEPGENDLGASLSATRFNRAKVTYADETGNDKTKEASAQGIANAFPEIHFHRGLLPDLEAGARASLASGYFELEGKYRFYRDDHIHAAVAPAVGLAPWGDLAQMRLVLPVLATYDLNNRWGVTAGLHAGYRWVHLDRQDEFALPQELDDLRWSMGDDSLLWGGGVGFDWRTDAVYLRPMLTIERNAGLIGAPGQEKSYGVTVVQLTFAGGWTFGKEVRRLKDQDSQLDTLIQGRTKTGTVEDAEPVEPEPTAP